MQTNRAEKQLKKDGYAINRYKKGKSWFVSLENLLTSNEDGQDDH